MFQLQDINLETLSTDSLSGTYSIRPELATYSAIDANESTEESSASHLLVRDIKRIEFADQDIAAYLGFRIESGSESNSFFIKASNRYFFDDSDENFLPDSSWSSGQWLKLDANNVSLVASIEQATEFQFFDASDLINFVIKTGSDFNPASIAWQTNSFADWPKNSSTGEIQVNLLSDHPLMSDGKDRDEVDSNYQLQFGTDDSSETVAGLYLDYIEKTLNDAGESMRYDKSLYLAVRKNMLSHSISALDEYNAELGYPTVPFVYFTNAQDLNGTHHPFMVVASINGSGGPNFLTDVARPPGDGILHDYSSQSITRNAVLESIIVKIPLKDYGLTDSLLDNNLSIYGSLLDDAQSNDEPTVFNYASNSLSGIAVDGVKIYPSYNNTLAFAQTNAEISSTGIHVGQGMGLHYHADGHSFNQNGINLYNSEDYENRRHPPVIGFALDGLALFGKYEIEYSNMHGFGTPLDQFGSHTHDGYGPHYHAFNSQVSDSWNGNDHNFTQHFLLVGAYRGRTNQIPGFQNISTNQLKDETLKKYVGAIGTYTGTDFNNIQYSVALTVSGNGSTIGSGIYDVGQPITLEALPGLGYLFSGWSGDLNSSENPLILSIDSNLSLVANFLVEPALFDFNSSVLTVYEDAGVGTEIGYVYRVSGDLNNTVEFSLESDGYESSFSVDNNGSIMVATGLDYESNASLPLTILGREGNRTLVKQFTVTVLDVNESTLPVVEPEPFDFNATLLEIPENSPVGTVVGYIYRISGDENQLAIFSSDFNSVSGFPFYIKEDGTVIVESEIDYEQNSTINIQVYGTQEDKTISKLFTINVLDVDETIPQGPVPDPFWFDLSRLSVPENIPLDTFFGEAFRVSGNLELNSSFNFEGNSWRFSIYDGK